MQKEEERKNWMKKSVKRGNTPPRVKFRITMKWPWFVIRSEKVIEWAIIRAPTVRTLWGPLARWKVCLKISTGLPSREKIERSDRNWRRTWCLGWTAIQIFAWIEYVFFLHQLYIVFIFSFRGRNFVNREGNVIPDVLHFSMYFYKLLKGHSKS